MKFKSWNPLRGCTRISSGCLNCFAERFAHRMSEPGQPYEGLTVMTRSGPRWTGEIRLVPELLDEPLHWRKPTMVFVNSMSDVFHEKVPDEFIKDLFDVMERAGWHGFFTLTKRAQRMYEWCARWRPGNIPKNVWLGISVENQRAADQRVPWLVKIDAGVKFLNCEPLVGPVDLSRYFSIPNHGISAVDVGPESGFNARPMDLDWVRSLRDQCLDAGVLFNYREELDGVRWRQSIEPRLDAPPALKKPAVKRPRASAQLAFDFGS